MRRTRCYVELQNNPITRQLTGFSTDFSARVSDRIIPKSERPAPSPTWTGRETSLTTAGQAKTSTQPGLHGRLQARRISPYAQLFGGHSPSLGTLGVHQSRPLPAVGRCLQSPE